MSWTTADSAELFRIDDWGKDLFEIGSNGHLVVKLDRESDAAVDLYEVVQGLEERGIRSPVTIGFPDLLRVRMRDLADAFANAISENGYGAGYTGVYPIKVNQQRFLVENVERLGRSTEFGFEVGSKPELLAIMAMTTNRPERLIVCNGFKEDRYVQQILLATKLGRKIVAVVENLDELDLMIATFAQAKARPRIGIRLKLESLGSGRWRHSTGEKAKFGLGVADVLDVVRRLGEAGMLDCLVLLHCHMGSQLSDIQVVNDGLGELTRVYVELCRLGAGLCYLDVGGGLGVDYDGSKTNSDFSINYDLQEYASTVIYRVKSGCDEGGVAHPTIVTEAGRALVSHYCVLVCNVLGVNRVDRFTISVEEARGILAARDEVPRALEEVLDALESVSPDRLVESFHDAAQARAEALTLFRVGLLDLETRGLVDRVFWTTCIKVNGLAHELEVVPEELQELDVRLSDTYFCNLSIFQSLPDAWAIDQVFPIMPIHRLDEEPERRATLVDITCDSDGRIDRFIDLEDIASTLPLHEIRNGEGYYLGIFLTGAYQETLGDLHNLFGDTNLVFVTVDEGGRWGIDEVVEGDTVSEVLSYLQYDPTALYQAIRRDCEESMRAGLLSVAEGRLVLEEYKQGLTGYTYLE
jgi:arginine decarboxylase